VPASTGPDPGADNGAVAGTGGRTGPDGSAGAQ
jgi:hypothetical protein